MKHTYSGLSKKMIERMVRNGIGRPGTKPGTLVVDDGEKRSAKTTDDAPDVNNVDSILENQGETTNG